MKKSPKRKRRPEVLPEYDFSQAIRGKYFHRYREGTNVVVLDPDVSGMFRTSKSVNDALRGLGKLIRSHSSTSVR